ncbi:hypothetical protein CEXT_620581, partial [Caerostris extrusa]
MEKICQCPGRLDFYPLVRGGVLFPPYHPSESDEGIPLSATWGRALWGYRLLPRAEGLSEG